MALNMQDSGRPYWPSSPYMDMHEPSSPNYLTYHPGKSTGLDTECDRVAHSPALSPTDLPTGEGVGGGWPRSPTSQDAPEPAAAPEPAGAEIYQVDLNQWYPQWMGCMRFFVDEGQHTPAVQSLAAFINLRLPCQRESQPLARFSTTAPPVALRTYIRRLIVTANDTPAVLGAFFGPDWVAGVGAVCQQERINYLFTAKSEGWAATKAAYDVLPDQQTPFLRPLREPTEEELRMAESRWSEWLAMEDWMVGPRSPW